MKSVLLGGAMALWVAVSAHGAEIVDRYQGVLDRMDAIHAQHPSLSQIFSIGKNDDGRDIMAMRVSTTPATVDARKVGYLIVSTHHGDEQKTPDFTLYFLEQLLKRFSGGELYRTALADTEWVIIPVLNISGYNANTRREHGIDPNRDYPGPCLHSDQTQLKSIQTLRNFLTTRIFAASLTVHGYAAALTYPWGVDAGDTHTQDQNTYHAMTAKAAALNGYRYGTSTEIVYPCDGSFEDYVYWKHGTWSLLLELRDGSTQDIKDTEEAITAWFNQVDSSPSTKNQLTSQCSRQPRLDLASE